MIIEAFASRSPDDVERAMELARCFLAQSQPRDARMHLDAAGNSAPLDRNQQREIGLLQVELMTSHHSFGAALGALDLMLQDASLTRVERLRALQHRVDVFRWLNNTIGSLGAIVDTLPLARGRLHSAESLYGIRCSLLSRLERWSEAEHCARFVIERAAAHTEGYYHGMTALYAVELNRGNLGEALKALTAAIRNVDRKSVFSSVGDQLSLRAKRAELFQKMGRTKLAILDLEAYAELAADHGLSQTRVETLMELSRVIGESNPQRKLEVLHYALWVLNDLHADLAARYEAEIYRILADMKLRKGELPSAITYARRAIAIEESKHKRPMILDDCYFTLASALEEQGDFEQALRALEQAERYLMAYDGNDFNSRMKALRHFRAACYFGSATAAKNPRIRTLKLDLAVAEIEKARPYRETPEDEAFQQKFLNSIHDAYPPSSSGRRRS